MCQGILEHVQIGFTDCYNAVLQMQVQSVLVDFRFRDQTVKELFGSSGKESREEGRLGQGLPFKCSNAAEFFFCSNEGQLPREPSLKAIDQIYQEYTRVLTQMYELARTRYNYYLTTFLTEDQRSKLCLKLSLEEVV